MTNTREQPKSTPSANQPVLRMAILKTIERVDLDNVEFVVVV
jgi:hypothetical protein